MHKQLQKLGLFISKNNKEEIQPIDKTVKYLYRKETNSVDRSHQRKIKSADDADKYLKRLLQEEKHKHRHKSKESLAIKHKNTASETEIFFISPDEIKKHRKKTNRDKSPEKIGESSKKVKHHERKLQKKEDELAKLQKQHNRKNQESDHKHFTKKEILKIIDDMKNDPKNTSTSPYFLKKMFLLEKEHSKIRVSPVREKVPQKNHRSDKNKHKTSAYPNKVSDKSSKSHGKRAKEQSLDIVYVRDSKKEENKKSYKHHKDIDTKKKKESKMVFEELKIEEKKPESRKRSKDRNKAKKEDDITETMNKVNPSHKKCLVTSTFSVVKITPTVTESLVEQKKQSKNFKKYYYYDNEEKDKDSEGTNNSTNFSDSHKMYQEPSEGIETKEKANLHLEANISSVDIQPDESKMPFKPSVDSKGDKEKRPIKSRIPVLSTSPRHFESVKTPRPKSANVSKIKDSFREKSSSSKSSTIGDKSNRTPRSQTKSTPRQRGVINFNKKFTNSSTSRKQESVHAGNQSPSNNSSSVWSKSSKKSNKTSLDSKSDTKLTRRPKLPPQRKYRASEVSSTRTSISNSTCGDKSLDCSRNGTSFLLTKTFKDEDKINRWQKRKLYSDQVRKNAISKSQNKKVKAIPPQIMEVRYLTVNNENSLVVEKNESLSSQRIVNINSDSDKIENVSGNSLELTENDLPPSLELLDNEVFKELFDSPTDDALNEILNENYHFLKKDFSLVANNIEKNSESDVSSNDLLGDEWYSFQISEDKSLSDISCCQKNSSYIEKHDIKLGSQDYIVDSLSAPGSEESGYVTINSRPVSRSFFDRPEIKSLLKPTYDTPQQFKLKEFQIESSSSNGGLEIRSIESKSLQTTIECSNKSVQLKLSQEEIVENILHFSDGNDEKNDTVDENVKDVVPNQIPEKESAAVEDTVCVVEETNQNGCFDAKDSSKSVAEQNDNLKTGPENLDLHLSTEILMERKLSEQIEINEDKTWKVKKRKKQKTGTSTKLKRLMSSLFCLRGSSTDK